MVNNKYVNFELFKNGPIVIFIWKNEEGWPVESVSENIYKSYGYKINEFTQGEINYLNLIHKDDVKTVCQEVIDYSNDLSSDSFIHLPYRILDKQGNYKWVKDITTIIREHGRITHYIGYIIDITNEISLKDENERYKLALQSIKDGLWDWDIEKNEVYYSSTLKQMLGYKDDEFENTIKQWQDKIHPEDIKKTLNDLNNHLYGKTDTYKNEHRLLCKDGSYKWILGRADVVEYTIDKKPKRIIGTHTDISNRKKYELELIQSELKFSQMFQAHSSVMFLIKPSNGKIIDANNSASEFYGYTIDELKKMYIHEVNYEIKENLEKKRINALEGVNNYFQSKHILKDGTLKDIEVYSSPIKTSDGIFLFSIVHDITIRNKLKKEIIKEKNFVSAIIENANSIIAVINKNGVMVKLNKYGLDFLKYSKKDIVSTPFFWKKFLSIKEQEKAFEVFQRAKEGSIAKQYRNAWISKNGEERFFEWSNTLIKNNNNQMQYLVTIGTDITEQEKQKKELQFQKEEFETIFNNAKDGIAILNLEGFFLEFNDEFLQIIGYTREELLSKTLFDITIPSEQKHAIEAINEVKEKGYKKNYQRTYLNKNDEIVILNISTSLMPDKNRILVTAKDITKDKIFEQQSKLASMGEMIGNIAHQWRQPLSIISGVSSNIKLFEQLNKNIDSTELVEYMNTINEQVQYLSKTIDDFRNFIKNKNKKEFVNIQEVLDKTLQILKPSLDNNNIRIHKDLKSDLKFEAYTNELIQSFINIINNSKDAIIQNHNEDGNKVLFITTKKIENNLILEFKDNGGGVKEEIKDKIFEPYFTTKHQSIGTGIGLSMTYKILTEHHNCKIEVINEEYTYNNNLNKGLNFRIIFKSEE